MTKIILAYELLEAGISKSHIAQHLGVSRRTIIRWSQVTVLSLRAPAYFPEYASTAQKASVTFLSVHCGYSVFLTYFAIIRNYNLLLVNQFFAKQTKMKVA